MKFVITSPLYSERILTSIKSKWVPWLFTFPAGAYIFFIFFETELTRFIMPLFPEESDKSLGFYRDFLRLCFNEMLWISFFLFLTWVIVVYVPLRRLMNGIEQHVLQRSTAYVAGIVCLSFALPVFIAFNILEQFPNSADEYVYLYQAEALSQGKLTYPAHPLSDFFHFNHIVQKDGSSAGRFPPGWPLLLALPFVLNIPALWLNPVLGVITLLVFYSFVRTYYSSRVAFWSLISLAFTGYFIFHSASFFSHTACLLFTLAFVYCLHAYHNKQANVYPLIAGVFLGLVIVTRYYTAVLVFLPVLISLFYLYRWKAIRPLFLIGLGSLPFIVFLAWYNYQITGNPVLPVTSWADRSETLGFVKGHTVAKGVEHIVRRIFLFVYWSSPGLMIMYFIFLFQKVRHKFQRYTFPEDYFMLFLLLGYFFYHHLGGNQYGPRFLFEAYPFLVVFVVNQTLKARAKWPLALLAAGMVYAIVKLPYIIEREHRVVYERQDLYARVNDAKISHAVVLISSHTSVIRPMPVSDLTRNKPDYSGDIIYAHDRKENNVKLLEYYPDRAFYKYVRNPERVNGELMRIR